MLREAGISASSAQIHGLMQADTRGELPAVEDEDAPEDLCSFCKPKGTPCCMKCLMGKGSKKIIQLNGRIHGFAT